MDEALRLGEDARGQSAPNPNVGCVIASHGGRVVGRGATAPGGRPHAEAVALAQAGKRANGATVYVTLEPCAHDSARGPACTDLLLKAKPDCVVIALKDTDPRTSGKGIRKLRRAGIEVNLGMGREAAKQSLAGWLTRLSLGRPRITLKLALSIDGKIALPSGESKWITGEDARAHVHLERARSDMILVGRGTYMADQPQLDVRLPGLEERSPRRALLTRGEAVDGWEILRNPQDVSGFMTSMTCWLRADRRPPRPFSVKTWSTESYLSRADHRWRRQVELWLCRARRNRRCARPLATYR